MTDLLFYIPETLSPRLVWMLEHKVTTGHNGDNNPDDEDEFGNTLWPWMAWIEGLESFEGAIEEDEAIAKLAKANGWKLWNELCPSLPSAPESNANDSN